MKLLSCFTAIFNRFLGAWISVPRNWNATFKLGLKEGLRCCNILNDVLCLSSVFLVFKARLFCCSCYFYFKSFHRVDTKPCLYWTLKTMVNFDDEDAKLRFHCTLINFSRFRRVDCVVWYVVWLEFRDTLSLLLSSQKEKKGKKINFGL